MKSKCAPGIYRKYSAAEKVLWDNMYNVFLWELQNLKNQKHIDGKLETIAHNLATLAISCEKDFTIRGK